MRRRTRFPAEQEAEGPVVVVGGGFAGLAAARRLAGAPVEVCVVDEHNFHTFQPLLYQVATAGLDTADVAYPIRTVFRKAPNVRFVHGRASSIDVDGRVVGLEDGTTLHYHYLVVASGAAAAFLEVPGVKEHALSLYTLDDARRVRNEVLSAFEEADLHPADFAGGAPAIVVVGGGPTGVETAGALSELLDITIRHDGLRLDPERSKVVLLDARERLLPGFAGRASVYAAQALRSRGVEVRLGASVAAVSPREVTLTGGEKIPAAAVIWVTGVTVQGTLASTLPAARGEGGRVMVRRDLSLPGHPEVFVVGDAAAIWSPPGSALVAGERGDTGGSGRLCPQVAQVAIQSGMHAATQILNQLAGIPSTEEFAYRDRGMMATVGRRAAIAQLPGGPVIRGTPGWLAWLALHLVYLIGFRNRALVLVNWAWCYFRWPSGPRLILGDIEPRPRSATSRPGGPIPPRSSSSVPQDLEAYSKVL